jgi:CHAT domain-containing protein/Tfp pilus assembly protein PilF
MGEVLMGSKKIGRLLIFVIAFVASASASETFQPGIVIETVVKNSASEKAGLEQGDVILRWSRSDATGDIQSPFGLGEVETEQAPRGVLTLEGLRDGAPRQWRLGPGDWGVGARPNFRDPLLSIYQDGQRLAKQGRLDQAVERWQAAVDAQRPCPELLSSWLFFHSAELLSTARHWKEADEAYEQAIEKLSETGYTGTVTILRARAGAFEKQSDWINAEKNYLRALSESRRTVTEGLLVAQILDDLGNMYRQRGDLVKAREYFQSALDIRARHAPGSLANALSWYNLGTINLNRGDLPAAEKYLQDALELRQKFAPGSLVVADSLSSLGTLAQRRGNLDKAEELHRQALNIREQVASGGLEVARSLHNLGRVAESRGNLAVADDLYHRALDLEQKLLPGSLDVAATVNSRGNVAFKQGDLEKADEWYHQALEISKKLAPESLNVAYLSNNLGLVAMQQGDMARAEKYLRQGLDIRRQLAPGSLDVAASLQNLGAVAYQRGDFAKADVYFREDLAIARKLAPEGLDTAACLGNLGTAAKARGDLAAAEEYHRQELHIIQKLAPGSLDVAAGLSNLGDIALERKDLMAAEEYHLQALDIKQKLAPASLSLSLELDSLGVTAMQRGSLPKADEYLQQALEVARKIAPKGLETASALQHLGDLAGKRNDSAQAEEYYRRALAIREEVAPGTAVHAETLTALAKIVRQRGKLEDVTRLLDQAIEAFENQTSHLGGTEGDSSKFRAKYAGAYKDYIDLLVAEDKSDLALQTFERWRARSLLEMLNEARINIHNDVDPALMERRRSLQESLAVHSNRRVKILNGKHTDEQVDIIDRKLSQLLAEQKDLESQIRATSPIYAALTQPRPLSVNEIQQLLDQNTLLLEYSLGEERSYVWAITSNSLAGYELPRRAAIEKLALRLYGLVTERNRKIKSEGEREREKRLAREDGEYPLVVAELSRMILGPVAAHIARKRLVIVSDGALQYIPFALLRAPGPPDSGRVHSRAPLIVEYEVVSLPSASVLAQMRQRIMKRTQPPKAVAVLADPVFDTADSRINRGSQVHPNVLVDKQDAAPTETSGVPERLTRSVADVGNEELHLSRLTFTRREAKAIMDVTPPGQGMDALDFKASRATATSPDLAQYRIVHFATHGLLDNKHPELSGLVLSLVDEQGQPQNGYLELEDIYNLNLPAELVVLSGCETGLGEDINGEGLVGLTRGFMYAGAARVLASLWKVDDVATAELMKRFYKAMEQGRMSPAAALRQAQIEMWRQPRWASPYYWAGFVLQGEWK